MPVSRGVSGRPAKPFSFFIVPPMCGWLGQLGIKVIVRPAFGFVWVAAYSFCTSGDKFWIQCSVGNFKRVNYFGGDCISTYYVSK